MPTIDRARWTEEPVRQAFHRIVTQTAACVATVIVAVLLIARAGSHGAPSGSYGAPVRLASLKDKWIDESSGLAASRRSDTLLWTHNDSGDDPLLFATDFKGRALARFFVVGAKARDWEDLAAGPGPAGPSLYIGDIGDNLSRRARPVVYRVPEPVVDMTKIGITGRTAPAERFPFRYPDGRHNAETLLVHPKTGDVYIVTKGIDPPIVYRFPLPLKPNVQVTLERVAKLPGLSTMLTGGAISPDGRRVALRDYLLLYEYRLPEGRSFPAIFRQTPERILYMIETQGEAITYRRDGRALLTTSEGRPAPLHELVLRTTDDG
jgi:hypothetical protein